MCSGALNNLRKIGGLISFDFTIPSKKKLDK